ncbi:MAG TPA: class I SAM-dependent methyltransferase [Clostridiales bacterium]|nr:class I SAM-dependent methyltransferase [Clostridiales bacterium]
MENVREHNRKMKQFFDNCAENWDNKCSHNSDKLAAIVTLAGIRKGFRVADIACGTGVLFPEILKREPELLLGIDLSDEMLKKAREKFAQPNIRLYAGDLFDVAETGFDAAFLYSAYPHFPDKPALAQQVSRMLKPRGRFLIAHSESRERINLRHQGREVSGLSWPLRPAREEAAVWERWFSIDLLADNDEFYLISGTKSDMG